jgi:hypothetical protein
MILEARFGPPMQLLQRCACGKENLIEEENLLLGVVSEVAADPNIIQLPACACGGVESLNRYSGPIPPGAEDAISEHRVLVNTVADCLKSRGRSHAGCLSTHQSEPPFCHIGSKVFEGVLALTKPPVHG